MSFKHCCEITVNRRKKLFQASERERKTSSPHKMEDEYEAEELRRTPQGDGFSVWKQMGLFFFLITSINSKSEFVDTCTGHQTFKIWNRKDSRSNVLEASAAH